jgi:3-oxoacyl-[acyl-carrier-protein] synthase-3
MNAPIPRIPVFPTRYRRVHLVGSGLFMPGPPVPNADIDRYVAPLNRHSERIKRRVLADNGIETRHYAIDEAGNSLHSSSELAARAVHDCLQAAGVKLEEVGMLCTGSSGGDTGMPGFASMLQGELGARPMEISSHQGICGAGIAALTHAASAIELGTHARALVATSEFPSRLFKRSRFVPSGYDTDFDAHFLRWMLSDGAGAWLLADQPAAAGLSLRLDWVCSRSFAGDLPVCMQVGFAHGKSGKSYLDYPSLAEAERDGAFLLRQDTRLLPQLFDLGIHEYANLVRAGCFDPARVDHFLCHYSSEKFAGVIEDLMERAGLRLPRERWYSNLRRRGNTGAASIFIMLADFLRERAVAVGQEVLCFVPESGRFTVSFLKFTVVDAASAPRADRPGSAPHPAPAAAGPAEDGSDVLPPHLPLPGHGGRVAHVLRELAGVWHGFRSEFWRTPLVRRIVQGRMSPDDYLAWMACWIPQVREGSLWMREAVRNTGAPYERLVELIRAHADDEQHDFRVLFDDYRAAGGTAMGVEDLRRNPGGDALNSYMHAAAAQPNPIGLLGGIYIIEGTGQRIIPSLLPRLRRQLQLPESAYRFLRYHGENDVQHLARWMDAVTHVLDQDPEGDAGDRIIATARDVAALYVMQARHVL